MRVALLAFLVLSVVPFGWSQSDTQNPAPAAAPTAAAPTAVPYSDKEFAPWVLKLRRAEIIAVGAFPLTYLLAGLGYDYTFYLSSGFPQANAPWPVGPGTSQWTASQPDLLQRKNVTLVSMAVGISLLIAAADWVLGL